jgi:hypothetical protein
LAVSKFPDDLPADRITERLELFNEH